VYFCGTNLKTRTAMKENDFIEDLIAHAVRAMASRRRHHNSQKSHSHETARDIIPIVQRPAALESVDGELRRNSPGIMP